MRQITHLAVSRHTVTDKISSWPHPYITSTLMGLVCLLRGYANHQEISVPLLRLWQSKLTNKVPLAQSIESVQSYRSGEVGWDKIMLLNLCDSVRASIKHEESVGPDAIKLGIFLEAVLKEEDSRHPTMDFVTIEYARLDKLVEELLQFAELMNAASNSAELPLRFLTDVAHCKKLRTIWRHRFREQYVMIDQLRCAVMVKGGRLKNVSFASAVTYDLGMWHTEAANLVSEAEGNQQFEPG